MATSKFAFTDLQMLRVAFEMAKGTPCDDAIIAALSSEEYDPNKQTVDNFMRKVSHKIHVMERAKTKPATKSKVRVANENIANAYLATLASGDTFNLSDLMNENPTVTTYSKAAAVVNIMIENGSVVRNGSLNGKAVYKAN